MSNTIFPRVSVLMPAFNGGQYIRASIRSVLDQTFKDFELIVVDDGSIDDTATIVRSFDDPRIRLLRNETNLGLSRTRNRCIREARGTFLAWLDCDDLATSTRLEKQIGFLERHPACGMIGAWVSFIDQEGASTGHRLIFNAPSEVIPALMLFRCAFQQSALTMRRSTLPDDCYDETYPPVEDFEFFVRLVRRAAGWNLPEVLCSYRQHGMNVSVRAAAVAASGLRKLLLRQLVELGVDPTDEELDLHVALGNMEALGSVDPQAAHEWLQRLVAANCHTRVHDPRAFAYVIAERWMYVCWSASGKPTQKLQQFVFAPLLNRVDLPFRTWATLLFRNGLKRWQSGRGILA